MMRVAFVAGVASIAGALHFNGSIGPTAAVAVAAAAAAAALLVPRRWFAMPMGTKHIRPYPDDGSAPIRVRRAYELARQAFGAPPAGPVAALCRSELLAGPSMVFLYEIMLAHAAVDRFTKEAIAEAVSVGNQCQFCSTAHTLMKAAAPQVGKDDAADATMTVSDVSALAEWASGARLTPRNATASASQKRPFSDRQAPEVLGVVILFHFINRVVDIFVDEFPLQKVPAPIRPLIMPVMDRMLRASTRVRNTPGGSFPVLSPSDPVYGSSNVAIERAEEELPANLRRVLAANANVLLATELWSRACSRLARGVLRKESRDILRDFVHRKWDGQQRLSTAWAADLAATSPHPGDRLVLHVALLAVVGPFQLTSAEINAAISARGDEEVVNAVAFAACEAAKAIGDRVAATL